ncbi:MAG: hypothetical protein Q7K35_05090 [bacterium]|nr:hypothetical protein [bacterium]
MKHKLTVKIKGFSLTVLLAILSIIGLIAVVSAVVFNSVRMNTRDATRVANNATITRALAMYLKDSRTGYPPSTGECLKSSSGVGSDLLGAGVLLVVPVDPLWSTAAPTQTGGAPNAGQTDFCYFYYSKVSDQYKISFFLESSSKAGPAGINTTALP